MSQAALAGLLTKEIGKTVDPTTITRLESGKRPVTVAELLSLCSIFGIQPTELLPSDSPIVAEIKKRQALAEQRTREVETAEDNVHLATSRRDSAREAVNSFRKLLDIKRDGTPLTAAAQDIRRAAWHFRDGADGFVEVLRDLGVPDDVITQALESVDRDVAKEQAVQLEVLGPGDPPRQAARAERFQRRRATDICDHLARTYFTNSGSDDSAS